jgi:hypothetical protein
MKRRSLCMAIAAQPVSPVVTYETGADRAKDGLFCCARSRRSCGEVARPLVAVGDFGTLRSLPSTLHQRRGRAERYIIRTYRSWPS